MGMALQFGSVGTKLSILDSDGIAGLEETKMLSECGIQHGAELSIVLEICGCKLIEEELKNLSADAQDFHEEVEFNQFSRQETAVNIYRPSSSTPVHVQPSKDGICWGKDWWNVGVLSEDGLWTEHG